MGRFSVLLTLLMWRLIYRLTRPSIDTKRYIPGSVPTWAEWSGATWVARHEVRPRALEKEAPHKLNQHLMRMQLALPPGWEPCQHDDEERTLKGFGRWLTPTVYEPPHSSRMS